MENPVNKSHPFFPGDSYATPATAKRCWADRLFLGTRWYFVYGYMREIIQARKLALKNRYSTQAWARSSYNIVKLVERCGGKIRLEGLNNLKGLRGPVVFVGNHMSSLETFVMPCIISPVMNMSFVVKESLVNHFLLGPVIRAGNPVVVTRKHAREDMQVVLNKGKDFLALGTSIVIFPQHTRSAVFNPEQFNSLGIKLAKIAGVNVVPFALKTDFWENGKVAKDIGPVRREKPVHMVFGAPLEVKGNGREEHRKVIEFIQANLEKWKVEEN